jgi:hypothetical protein
MIPFIQYCQILKANYKQIFIIIYLFEIKLKRKSIIFFHLKLLLFFKFRIKEIKLKPRSLVVIMVTKTLTL